MSEQDQVLSLLPWSLHSDEQMYCIIKPMHECLRNGTYMKETQCGGLFRVVGVLLLHSIGRKPLREMTSIESLTKGKRHLECEGTAFQPTKTESCQLGR